MGAAASLGTLLILLLAALFFCAAGTVLSNIPIVGPSVRVWADNMSKRSFRSWKVALEYPIFILSAAFSKIGRHLANTKTLIKAALAVPIAAVREAILGIVASDYTELWQHASLLAIDLTAEMGRDYVKLWDHASALAIDLTAEMVGYYSKAFSHASTLAIDLTAEMVEYYSKAFSHASILAIDLTAEMGRDLTWTKDLINTRNDELEKNIDAQIAATAASIAALTAALTADNTATLEREGEIAATIAAVGDAVDDMRKYCTDNLCDNLGDLAGILSDIDTMAIIAALFEFLREAFNNPKGAAQEIENAVDGPLNTAKSIIDEFTK